MPKTVLVLAPHPDDAEFFAGGTIARFISEGAAVTIVIATDGRCGSFEMDGDSLVSIRSQEARRAAQLLGCRPPILLGYHDFELDRLSPGILREQFIRLIRQIKPDVLIAEDTLTLYEGHPDHRVVARAAEEAVSFAALPLIHSEHLAEGLTPHFVVEKYFYGEGSPGLNKVMDITATMEQKLGGLAAHESQMRFLVEDVMKQAQLAGLDLAAMLGGATDPMAAIRFAMQTQAAQVGAKIGVQFGEAFRYVRFTPLIEMLLAGQIRPAQSE